MADELKPNAVVPPAVSAPAESIQEQINATPAPAPDASLEEKTRFQKRIDQLTAARRAAEEETRVYRERLSQVEQQRVIPPGVRPGQQQRMVGQMAADDWQAWHDEDPIAAYEYMADVRANVKAEQVIQQISRQANYSEARESVFKEHPELKEVMDGKKSPDEVPFWSVYDEVAREMPEASQMARGPYIVMKEAERRMKERTAEVRERQIAEDAAVQENQRQTRVGASHTLGSTGRPATPGSVKLSPEEEKIARKMGMTPEEYSSFKK